VGSPWRKASMNMLDKLKTGVHSAFQFYAKNGLLPFLKVSLFHLGFQWFDRTLIFLFVDLNSENTESARSHALSIFSAEDIFELGDKYDDGFFSRTKALSRLSVGHRLFVLKEGQKMAFSLWVEKEGATIWWFNDLPLILPNTVAYMSAVYTSPEFRNRGIASKIKREVFGLLKNEGIARVIEVINPNNSIALRVDRRLGFKDYQVIRYRRYWFIRYYLIHKVNSDECRRLITMFRSPKNIWDAYLPKNNEL
jgi:ribosomal protein S18 acetylase RimI-like enzyme